MPPRLRAAFQFTVRPPPLRESNDCPSQSLRVFSTSSRQETRQRRIMFSWLRNQGANFEKPLAGSTNYLGAYNIQGFLKRTVEPDVDNEEEGRNGPRSQNPNSADEGDPNAEKVIPPEREQDLVPFPLNKYFRSQRIVNEQMREDIWTKIIQDGQSVKVVSAELGVEMSRVGAVVRLKEVEKDWVRKGKRLALPYAKAVMEMLPKTRYPPTSRDRPNAHESINDLPVHAATLQQIFHPASESREFTRADAARVFDDTLLPADQRVPHPELAELEKERLAGIPYEERVAKAAKREGEAQEKKEVAGQRRMEKEAKALKIVNGKRWDFRFKEISVDDAGYDGRGHHGTGWRYGVPLMDRKRGKVKIPTRVA